jgi:hypothetical protein
MREWPALGSVYRFAAMTLLPLVDAAVSMFRAMQSEFR